MSSDVGVQLPSPASLNAGMTDVALIRSVFFIAENRTHCVRFYNGTYPYILSEHLTEHSGGDYSMARRSIKLTSDLKAHTGVLDVTGTITPVDFEEALHAFLRNCKLRNLSDQTVVYYRAELSWFRKLLERQDKRTDPDKVTLEIVEDNVILYLKETEGCKVTSINTLLRAVRIFFKFLYNKGYLAVNPIEGLALLKTEKTVVETFTNEQIAQLLRQPDQATFTGVRDYVMLLLFLETGVRLREMSEVKRKDIRWSDSQILVHGKNRHDRLVPFQRTMLRELKRWDAIRGDVDHDSLFINIDNGPLSKRQMQTRVSKYGRTAGIKDVRCSPHTLRHTFAKMSVVNGANVFDLQEILGHSSLEMVKEYVNLFANDVLDSHRRFSPLENLK